MNKQISPREADELRRKQSGTVFLDVREHGELAVAAIAGARHIPMDEVPRQVENLPAETPLVVICHHGMRSQKVVEFLTARGFDNALNLQGGIDAWSLEIDSSVPRY